MPEFLHFFLKFDVCFSVVSSVRARSKLKRISEFFANLFEMGH